MIHFWVCDSFYFTIYNPIYNYIFIELRGQLAPFCLGLCGKSQTQKRSECINDRNTKIHSFFFFFLRSSFFPNKYGIDKVHNFFVAFILVSVNKSKQGVKGKELLILWIYLPIQNNLEIKVFSFSVIFLDNTSIFKNIWCLQFYPQAIFPK